MAGGAACEMYSKKRKVTESFPCFNEYNELDLLNAIRKDSHEPAVRKIGDLFGADDGDETLMGMTLNFNAAVPARVDELDGPAAMVPWGARELGVRGKYRWR